MNPPPGSKGPRLRDSTFPRCLSFVVISIPCFLSLQTVFPVQSQETASGAQVAEGPEEGTPPAPVEALRMGRIQERIRMNSRVLDPFGFSMTSGKKAPEFVVEPEEEPIDEEQERPPSGLTSRAVEILPLTGIYPSKNQIVVRGRPYQAGASLSIQLEGVMLRLVFVSLEPGGIRFRDADTGEEVVRQVRSAPSVLPRNARSQGPPEEKGIFPRSGVIPIQ